MISTISARLLAGSALPTAAAIALATLATPAFAQTAATTTPSEAQQAEQNQEIVITGTMFKTATATVSPVTTVTVADLDKRGVSTIQDAIQTLASNNGPALTNSFTSNGAFAGGASAVSLRGLSTNSTLVLFDGMRAAYYPLADDGSRNFVDLNTIPDDIVDHIDVLRDGASSTYGADAIAGVVNIITKKEFKGFSARAETGIAERGDGAQYRLTATAGMGDLDENGYNAYISGFYYKADALRNSDRGYPYNSDDHRLVCHDGTCGSNAVVGGVSPDGVYRGGAPTAGNFLVRPYDTDNPVTAKAQGTWSVLNPSCPGSLYTLTAADRAVAANATAPNTVCQADYTKLYGYIQPKIERFGGSAHFTANVTDTIQAWVEVNFMQSSSSYNANPAVVYGSAPTGIFFPQFRTSGAGGTGTTFAAGSNFLTLPVWVCPERVNCATSANRQRNPNNPFANQDQVARVIGRDLDSVTRNATRNRSYRAAFGVSGDLTSNWSFDVGGTVMHTDLRRTMDGYVYIQHLLDVIADGTYNWRNPSATPQSVLNYLKPRNVVNASSDEDELQASIKGSLFDLPGGPLMVGVGGSLVYEAVDSPSANSDANGPTQRYFTLNAFGTKGHRTVSSAFFELDAPITSMIDVNASGRYDKYSSGQDAFSPKVGVKFKPVKQLLLRGTYSKGFRIPSFGEANALPTTGYVSNNSSLFNNTYLAQYGCTVATFNNCPAYIRSGSYGQTSLATPDLKPEKSRSFTGGVMLNPIRALQITVDYYNIKKTGAITAPSNSPALLAYYTGAAIPAGYTVIADAPDPAFLNAKPRVAFVQAHLVNANTIKTSGLDIGADLTLNLTPSIKWNSHLDASYIIKLETVFPDGSVERYDGTLGNFNLTAGSGTPKWHGYWTNTFDINNVQVSGTVNYFGGYDLSAMDQGTGYKDCGLSDGSVPCRVKNYITFDLNARIKIKDKFTLYGTILNLFDRMPPIDPVTYGANMYNPVQGGTGILGRYFKMGVKVDF